MNNYNHSRRVALKSSLFGLLAVSVPNLLYSKNVAPITGDDEAADKLFHRYPSIDDEIVAEVVGASHFNFDRIKELVGGRPELARATWDWAFGDWETALGAASHVGRRDIAKFLIEYGARPDIFTFAMFGQYDIVKSMIETNPGFETIGGPHGISLLSHAKAGLRANYGLELTAAEVDGSKELIAYLEKLGTADPQAKDIAMSEAEQAKFIGDFKYGDGPKDGLTVKLNMRQQLSLGRLGNSGGTLFQKAPNVFTYNGTTSVEIQFSLEENIVKSLTVVEPGLSFKAIKV